MENVMNVILLAVLVQELIQMNVLLAQMAYIFNQTIILVYPTVILDIMAIQLSKNVCNVMTLALNVMDLCTQIV